MKKRFVNCNIIKAIYNIQASQNVYPDISNTKIEKKSGVLGIQYNPKCEILYKRVKVKCSDSHLSGADTLIHKLAKIRILQCSNHSFFIIQLFIHCNNNSKMFPMH